MSIYPYVPDSSQRGCPGLSNKEHIPHRCSGKYVALYVPRTISRMVLLPITKDSIRPPGAGFFLQNRIALPQGFAMGYFRCLTPGGELCRR